MIIIGFGFIATLVIIFFCLMGVGMLLTVLAWSFTPSGRPLRH